MVMQNRGILNPWRHVTFKDGTKRLFGYIHDDPRSNPATTEFADGHRVFTGPVVKLDPVAGTCLTESGSFYSLGIEKDDLDLTAIQHLLQGYP